MRCGILLTFVSVAAIIGQGISAQSPPQSTPNPRPFTNSNNTSEEPRKMNVELPDWKLEIVELRDGRSFSGLIVRDSGDYLELEEVRRQVGRPMYLIRRRFPLGLVKMLTRVDEDDRKFLADQIQKHRNRNQEESELMGSVELLRSKVPGHQGWHYQSQWFDLESRMDEELTRRAIVRIEQMFAAFAVILPSSSAPRKDRLKIELFETNQSYTEFQLSLGVKLRHPAFYIRKQNVLAAGADLSALAKNLANVRGKNAATQKKLEELTHDLPVELKKATQNYYQQGRSPEEVKKLVQIFETKLQQELSRLQNDLRIADRKNSQQFETFTRAMFQRLYHEAFHAYLENFVFPAADFDVPRWLNEGLAQVFEEGILEAGTLRLDIPSQTRLQALQKDLRERDRLPLAELLNSEPRKFLVAHEDQAIASERLYLYSWGLAHYLVIREPVLQGKALTKYVQKSAANSSPQQQFEEMVGQPLDEFEKKWRSAMLNETK